MADYVDEGVVLRRINYGEADRILTVLTRGHGKLGLIVRGVRKPRSKMASNTDLFVRSQMQMARGRGELDVLIQAQRIAPSEPSQLPVRIACAAACAELIDRALEPHSPDEPLYDLVVATLDAILGSDAEPRSALVWFAQHIIERLGYAPELSNCARCGRPLSEQTTPFSAESGGLICGACGAAGTGSVACSVRIIKILRLIAAGDDATYARLRLEGSDLGVLERVVENELAFHLERQLRSFQVLHALT